MVDDGNGFDSQKELAWAEIGTGKTVPTLWLRKLDGREIKAKQKLGAKEVKAQGRPFDYEEVKEHSRRNRAMRLGSNTVPTGKCGICKAPTNQSFSFGGREYHCCDDHKELLFENVTGRKPKPISKPKR